MQDLGPLGSASPGTPAAWDALVVPRPLADKQQMCIWGWCVGVFAGEFPPPGRPLALPATPFAVTTSSPPPSLLALSDRLSAHDLPPSGNAPR